MANTYVSIVDGRQRHNTPNYNQPSLLGSDRKQFTTHLNKYWQRSRTKYAIWKLIMTHWRKCWVRFLNEQFSVYFYVLTNCLKQFYKKINFVVSVNIFVLKLVHHGCFLQSYKLGIKFLHRHLTRWISKFYLFIGDWPRLWVLIVRMGSYVNKWAIRYSVLFECLHM